MTNKTMNKTEEAINNINVNECHAKYNETHCEMQQLLAKLIEQDPENDTFNDLVNCNDDLEDCTKKYEYLVTLQSELIRDLKNEIATLKCKIADMAV